MRVIVATHGNCLDGLASAVLYTNLLRHVEPRVSAFEYKTCIYGPEPVPFGPRLLDGAINAILDYKFYAGPELTWYFDHHATAFSDENEESVFRDRISSGRYYFDSTSPSCAGLIGRVSTEKFGLPLNHLEVLVEYADSVDSAQYKSPIEALDRSTARAKFLAVVEHFGDAEFVTKMAPKLLDLPLDEVAESAEIVQSYATIERQQQEFLSHVRRCSEDRGAVVVSDVSDREHETFTKFASYFLFPHSTYSVLLGRIPGALKISVGFNPWGPRQRQHDLGSICRKFGGGGHSVVGGVAFGPNDIQKARAVMGSIIDQLESR